MRKKYLSALLFGALLVTSAGTFTSCKDYDDEINGLQEQINKVASDLESLKTTVDNLGGVTDVKIEGGKLLVTAGGQTVSYDLPAAAEVEQTTVELDGQDLKVNGEVIGQVGDKVTVNEDGYLCVNGTATEIKAGKYAVLDNDADGVVTITLPDANGELKTVELAKAVSSVSVDVLSGKFTATDNPTTQDDGINWGKVGSAIEWKGPKGNIAKDSYLYGQINLAQVSVLPLAYNLGEQNLKLINSKGEEAKVTVSAETTEGLLNSGSRAGAANLWDLKIDIDKSVKNTAFLTKDANDGNNVLYALSVNGTIVTGYDFVIDVANNAGSAWSNLTIANVYVNGKAYNSSTNKLAIGDNTFHYNDAAAYDYYIAFPSDFENDAEAMGVSIEGNVLKVSETAAGETVKLNIYAIDVTGAKMELTSRDFVVAGSTVDAEEIATVNHVASPDFATDGLVIDLGTTFSGLTAEQATKVSSVKWTTADDKFVFAAKGGIGADKNEFVYSGGATVAYFKDAACKQPVNPGAYWDDATNIKQIKYAKIKGTAYNTKAATGTHNATLTLFNGTSELKKVTVPVNVTLPSFEDMYTKTGGTVWDGDTYTVTVTGTSASPVINLTNAFTAKDGYVKSKLTVGDIKVDNKTAATPSGNLTQNITLSTSSNNATKVIDKTKGEIAVKTLPVTVTYAFTDNMKVSKSFNVQLRSIFEGAEVKYYVNNAVQAADYTVSLKNVGGAEYIAARSGNGTANAQFNGLSIAFNGAEVAYSGTVSVGGVTLGNTASGTTQVIATYTFESASYSSPTNASVDANGIKVSASTLTQGQGGTLVITFEDAVGIQTVKKINFVK